MEGFSDTLNELYRSFSSLGSKEQKERAVEELSVALQRMSATLDSPSDVLAEEATRIIAAEYGMADWDTPSTSYDAGMVESPYDAAHEMYEYSEALREEDEGMEGGALSLLNYWKENGYDESTIPSSATEGTEEERRKRLMEDNEESDNKRMRLEFPIEEETDLIECVICGMVISSFDEYISHMKCAHWESDENDSDKNGEEKNREFSCAQCNYVAGSRKTLWRHGRSTGHDWSKREIDYSCDKCEYSAGSKFNLDRHRMRNHALPQDIECPLCFSILPSIPSFLAHHESSHREKSYKFMCELCGKEFTRKDKLMRHHKVVHESLRSFPCPSCPSSFPSGWHLRRHQKNERGCREISQ